MSSLLSCFLRKRSRKSRDRPDGDPEEVQDTEKKSEVKNWRSILRKKKVESDGQPEKSRPKTLERLDPVLDEPQTQKENKPGKKLKIKTLRNIFKKKKKVEGESGPSSGASSPSDKVDGEDPKLLPVLTESSEAPSDAQDSMIHHEPSE